MGQVAFNPCPDLQQLLHSLKTVHLSCSSQGSGEMVDSATFGLHREDYSSLNLSWTRYKNIMIQLLVPKAFLGNMNTCGTLIALRICQSPAPIKATFNGLTLSAFVRHGRLCVPDGKL